MKIVSVEEMIRREKEEIEAGADVDKLMENAGLGMAEAIVEAYPDIQLFVWNATARSSSVIDSTDPSGRLVASASPNILT